VLVAGANLLKWCFRIELWLASIYWLLDHPLIVVRFAVVADAAPRYTMNSLPTPADRKPSPGFMRRSDRVALAVPIQVRGTDSHGQSFNEKTQTLVISRYGAVMDSARLLNTGQQLAIRCIGTGKEAAARVVEQLEARAGSYLYGVEIISHQANLWEINFPLITDTEMAAARMLLECSRCLQCDLAYLNLGEIEIFQKNQCVSRPCERCNNITVWIHAALQKLQIEAAAQAVDPMRGEAAPAALNHTEDERLDPRVTLCIDGCIRSAEFGEDIVQTENVAESGARFKSPKQYANGTSVAVAIPYLPGGANVFVQARIIWSKSSPGEGAATYGLIYSHAARRARRLRPKTTVSIAFIGSGFRAVGTIIDLSIRGVLVQCPEKFKVGDVARLGLEMGHETIRIAATVRRSSPAVGVAFEFTQMGRGDRSLLRRMIMQIEKSFG
jgi:hypothetical protein